jgi:hypothetical protein
MRNEEDLRYLLRKQKEGNTSTGALTEDEWERLNRYIPLTSQVLESCPSTTITNAQVKNMIAQFHHNVGNIGKTL